MITERMQQLAGVRLNEDEKKLQEVLAPYLKWVKSNFNVKKVEESMGRYGDSLVYDVWVKDERIGRIGLYHELGWTAEGGKKYKDLISVSARGMSTEIHKPQHMDIFFKKLLAGIERGIIPEVPKDKSYRESFDSSLQRKMGIPTNY